MASLSKHPGLVISKGRRIWLEQRRVPHSSFQNLLKWTFFCLSTSFAIKVLFLFLMNIFLFRENKLQVNLIASQCNIIKSTLWISCQGTQEFSLVVLKHILFLCICLQDCESENMEVSSAPYFFILFYELSRVRL